MKSFYDEYKMSPISISGGDKLLTGEELIPPVILKDQKKVFPTVKLEQRPYKLDYIIIFSYLLLAVVVCEIIFAEKVNAYARPTISDELKHKDLNSVNLNDNNWEFIIDNNDGERVYMESVSPIFEGFTDDYYYMTTRFLFYRYNNSKSVIYTMQFGLGRNNDRMKYRIIKGQNFTRKWQNVIQNSDHKWSKIKRESLGEIMLYNTLSAAKTYGWNDTTSLFSKSNDSPKEYNNGNMNSRSRNTSASTKDLYIGSKNGKDYYFSDKYGYGTANEGGRTGEYVYFQCKVIENGELADIKNYNFTRTDSELYYRNSKGQDFGWKYLSDDEIAQNFFNLLKDNGYVDDNAKLLKSKKAPDIDAEYPQKFWKDQVAIVK